MVMNGLNFVVFFFETLKIAPLERAWKMLSNDISNCIFESTKVCNGIFLIFWKMRGQNSKQIIYAHCTIKGLSFGTKNCQNHLVKILVLSEPAGKTWFCAVFTNCFRKRHQRKFDHPNLAQLDVWFKDCVSSISFPVKDFLFVILSFPIESWQVQKWPTSIVKQWTIFSSVGLSFSILLLLSI